MFVQHLRTGMSIKVRSYNISGGRKSLYLDIYLNKKRYPREVLELYLYPKDTHNNKEKLKLAEAIRSQRELELKNQQHGFLFEKKRNADFFLVFSKFIAEYKKTDKDKFSGALKNLKIFYLKDSLMCSEITKQLSENFLFYLQKNLSSETASSYFKLFRRVIRFAITEGFIKEDPSKEIINRNTDAGKLKKDYLLPEEMKQLFKATCRDENIKKAFIVSCYTGLRGCDLRSLKWREVKLSEKIFDLEQGKTDFRVVVDLNKTVIDLIGIPGKRDELVFNLPSDRKLIQKAMKRWCKAAAIDKHITFHCGRTSFATNLIANGTDLITVKKLMGLRSLKMLEKYSHAIRENERKAIAGLKQFKL